MRFDRRNKQLQFFSDSQFLVPDEPTVPLEADPRSFPEVAAMLDEIARVFPGTAERRPVKPPRRWGEVTPGVVEPYIPTSLFVAMRLKEVEGRSKAMRAAVKAGNPRVSCN